MHSSLYFGRESLISAEDRKVWQQAALEESLRNGTITSEIADMITIHQSNTLRAKYQNTFSPPESLNVNLVRSFVRSVQKERLF